MADDENIATVNTSDVEGETMKHVLPELVSSLDLSIIVDKLLKENLISSETHEHLTTPASGLTSNAAVREAMMKIKRNPPGYLANFIRVLRSEDRSKHFGDWIEQGNVTAHCI